MNILYLCHRIPYPPKKGDKIRSFNEIKYLSRNHRIFLGTILDRSSDEQYLEHLSPFCEEIFGYRSHPRMKLLASLFSGKTLSVSNFYIKKLQNYVDRVFETRKIDAVICFCSSMAEYIFNTPGYRADGLKGIKLILDYVDLDSDKWYQYSKYTRFPFSTIFKLEHRRLFEYEKRINRSFHHSVFVAQREVNIFKERYVDLKNTCVIPNGVDLDYFYPEKGSGVSACKQRERATPPVFVFTGVMNYFANEDGVQWFTNKIFPKIRAQIPGAKFYIVGNRPTRPVKRLGLKEEVTVTGYVDNIRNYYWMADICVIPLRIARGLQNKVLEAMACGKAVVATPNASEGIVCTHGKDILIANDEQFFADMVIRLANDPTERKFLGDNAVKNIKSNYRWDKQLQMFDKLLTSPMDAEEGRCL